MLKVDKDVLTKLVERYDTDKDTLLYTDEAVELLYDSFGFNVTQEIVSEIMTTVNPAFDAKLTVEEVGHLLFILTGLQDSKDASLFMFLAINTRHRSTVTKEEVRAFLAGNFPQFDAALFERIYETVLRDCEELDAEQFKQLMSALQK